MDLRWQLIASLLRRGSQSINLGQWSDAITSRTATAFRAIKTCLVLRFTDNLDV